MSVTKSNPNFTHPTSRPIAKRKRSGSNIDATTIDSDTLASTIASSTTKSHKAIKTTIYDDLLQILLLQPHASTILDADIEDARHALRPTSPSKKRAKYNHISKPYTIASQLAQQTYDSLGSLRHDIQDVCTAQVQNAEAEANAEHADDTLGVPECDKDAARESRDEDNATEVLHIKAFQAYAEDVIAKAAHDRPFLIKGSINGTRGDQAPHTLSRTVLSVFGNASTPRQLFSSLQQSESALADEAPLESLGLPNMLSASRVMSSQSASVNTRDLSELTLGKAFRLGASLPTLQTPKSSKLPVQARKTAITFAQGDLLSSKSLRATGYTIQPLRTGRWLGYGHEDGDPIRPQRKRKDRDSTVRARTSSIADAKYDASGAQAIEQSLFQSAYSSFAPSYDDSHALIPQRDLNNAWWYDIGLRSFENSFILSRQVHAHSPNSMAIDDKPSMSSEDHRIKAAVENMSEASITVADPVAMPIDLSEESVDALIDQVDGLLDTLSSYQDLRNGQSNIASDHARKSSVAAGSAAAASAHVVDSSNEPDAEEIRIFVALRSRLAELVSRLPPYMVAKQNGEQHEILRIDTRIRTTGQVYTGVLEEDQLTRMARSAAAAAAALAAAPSKTTSSVPQAAMAYNRNSSLAQNAIRAARPIRSESTSYSRSAPSRQSYSQAGNYNASANRAIAQTGQSMASRTTYAQSNGRVSPQVGSPAGAVKTQYQPRAPAYNSYANSYAASTASPAPASKTSAATPTAPMTNGQPSSASGSSSAVQTYPQGSQAQQSLSAKAQSPAGTPQPAQTPLIRAPSNLGPTGFHTSMSTEQQQLMIERQRAQVAAQTTQSPAPQATMAAATTNGTSTT